MLLELGRWPLTTKWLICVGWLPATPEATDTPGTRVAKLNSARSLLAMFLMASLSRENERSPLSAWSSVTRARTETSSEMFPISSVMVPAVKRSLAPTTTLVRSRTLKPCRLTRREYVSGRTMANVKRPAVSVVVLSALPCVRLFSVTAAPGRTAPCWSITEPVTEAVVVCAASGATAIRLTANAAASPRVERQSRVNLMNSSPREGNEPQARPGL